VSVDVTMRKTNGSQINRRGRDVNCTAAHFINSRRHYNVQCFQVNQDKLRHAEADVWPSSRFSFQDDATKTGNKSQRVNTVSK